MAEIKAFNSEEYGFVDLQVIMQGRPVIGLQGVQFEAEQQKGNIHGAGSKPIARTRGPVNYTGMVKVLMSELVALMQSQGQNQRLLKIRPFDIIVAFAPAVGDVVTTFRLVYCEFTKWGIDVKNGDQQIVVELPIVIGDIEENI